MTDFNLTTIGYLIYLPLVITLTIVTAHRLFSNGKVFMMDIFNGKKEIALATNQLFKIGFYLMNIGFALKIIELYRIKTTNDLIIGLSQKVGSFTIYLGILLFINLFLFMRGRAEARKKARMISPPTKVEKE